MKGGWLRYTPSTGPLFYVTNSTGIITLTSVEVTATSRVLVKASIGDWGKTGANGGTAIITADAQVVTGDVFADDLSAVDLTLKNGSNLTGMVTHGCLVLDSSSIWNVTGDSSLTSLTDVEGIAGETITNINGNGYTVTYDPTLPASSSLGGQTY